ncbi:MAG: host attachment protein [Hyphomicrobiales bacterium]|nr:MAG: host attachment protein [Hyphomicrobiales bacterium]
MKATVTWVLVANGAQAQVFEHGGPGKGLIPVKGLHFEQEPLRAQDINTDRPGRHFGGGAGSRSGMEDGDPVGVREERFVKSVAEQLEVLRQQGRFERLIIAAAPTALGDIRPALSDGVKQTIVAELPKDLTNVPTAQLAKHFDQLLAI